MIAILQIVKAIIVDLAIDYVTKYLRETAEELIDSKKYKKLLAQTEEVVKIAVVKETTKFVKGDLEVLLGKLKEN